MDACLWMRACGCVLMDACLWMRACGCMLVRTCARAIRLEHVSLAAEFLASSGNSGDDLGGHSGDESGEEWAGGCVLSASSEAAAPLDAAGNQASARHADRTSLAPRSQSAADTARAACMHFSGGACSPLAEGDAGGSEDGDEAA
eukprot:4087600-Pleurochrysis_carterae.AAC.1